MIHEIYFDRVEGSIYGRLTLQRVQNGNVIKLFERLPVTSGQSGYTFRKYDWVTGKGATPFGRHWLSTRKEALLMTPTGTPFYVISTVKGKRTIDGPDGKFRTDGGLHLENKLPGTAGCTALECNTPERLIKSYELFDTIDGFRRDGILYVPYIVT